MKKLFRFKKSDKVLGIILLCFAVPAIILGVLLNFSVIKFVEKFPISSNIFGWIILVCGLFSLIYSIIVIRIASKM